MPPLPSPGKVIRLDFLQTLAADTAIRNRLFFSYSGTVSSTDLATLLGTASAAWGTQMVPNLTPAHSLNSIVGTDLQTSSGAQVINGTVRAGTNAGTPLPAGTALVLKFKIARRYRGGHPRFYLCGIATTSVGTGQTWAAATVSIFVTSITNLVSTIVTTPPTAMGTLAHVNVSFFAGFTNRTFPSGRVRPVPSVRVTPLVDAVLGYSGNPKFGSQRRRNLQSP